jgi:putative ABC transport system ATP-binding protein
MKADEVVRMENVSKFYNGSLNNTRGVTGINLCAFKGELLLILGPSGSGKTTLITLAAGLLKPTGGNVFLFGKNISSYSGMELQKIRADSIGFIFQNFLLIDSLTVKENINMVQGFSGKNNHTSPSDLLDKFSIGYLRDSFPSKLSQGEKQRAAIARAIANNAELILADEPTASLESSQGYEIIKLLGNYAREENKCVLAVSHDLRIADYADRKISIVDGRIQYS